MHGFVTNKGHQTFSLLLFVSIILKAGPFFHHQIARARANLDGYYFRIEAIERTLRLKDMSDEER